MKTLEPNIGAIEERMELLLRAAPPLGPVAAARLVAGGLALKLLAGGGTDDFLQVLQQGDATEATFKLQRELAVRDASFVGKRSKGRGLPRTHAAFLQRIGSLPTESALELAYCPDHPDYGASGLPFVHLLALLRHRELLLAGKTCSLDEIVRWGRKWEDRQRVVGWQILEPGTLSSPARVFVIEEHGVTVYHWLGFRIEEALRDDTRLAGEFAAAPTLDGLEQNEEVAAELVPLLRQKVEARDMKHVVVADFGSSPLKQADVDEIIADLGVSMKLVDVLDI
jgi:hypothetical protein